MQRYLCILRGINVSGQKKVKMAELVSVFESLGLKNIQTYIQSGNVVFSSSSKDTGKLARKIEREITDQFGFDVPVLLRTKNEIDSMLKINPFLEKKGVDESKLHVTLLAHAPDKSVQKMNATGEHETDRFVLKGDNVFLYCPGGYGKTRFSNVFLEKLLGVTATTRNWKTINALVDLLKGEATKP